MGCGASCACFSSSDGGCCTSEPVKGNQVAPGDFCAYGVGQGGSACLVIDGKQTGVPDYTFVHSHDPYVAVILSWYKEQLSKNPNIKISENDINKTIKEFFKEVKKYNVDTNFSAKNSAESHVETLKKRFAQWYATHGPTSAVDSGPPQNPLSSLADKAKTASDYAQIVIYAAVAKLLGQDDDNRISDNMVKYTETDPGWVTTVFARLQHPGSICYRPAPSLSSYVYPLRSLAGSGSEIRIALFSDWGTGSPQAFDLLHKVARFKPDIAFHLGDVYYSGTEKEEVEYVYQPVRSALKGVQFYNLPGNHDYYAGGAGYLKVIDQFREDKQSQQEASFFCLDGDKWVIVGFDTALFDADPLQTVAGAGMPHLDEREAEWIRDKVKKAKAAGKKVIFLSHHQWCTLCSTTGKVDGVDQALNPELHRQLGEIVADVDVWYWGHEHSLQFFLPYMGLRRGRLIGNGSVPTLLSQTPYKPKAGLAPPTSLGCNDLPTVVPGSPQMSVANFGYYYNNSFVILTLSGNQCKADYYGPFGARPQQRDSLTFSASKGHQLRAGWELGRLCASLVCSFTCSSPESVSQTSSPPVPDAELPSFINGGKFRIFEPRLTRGPRGPPGPSTPPSTVPSTVPGTGDCRRVISPSGLDMYQEPCITSPKLPSARLTLDQTVLIDRTKGHRRCACPTDTRYCWVYITTIAGQQAGWVTSGLPDPGATGACGDPKVGGPAGVAYLAACVGQSWQPIIGDVPCGTQGLDPKIDPRTNPKARGPTACFSTSGGLVRLTEEPERNGTEKRYIRETVITACMEVEVYTDSLVALPIDKPSYNIWACIGLVKYRRPGSDTFVVGWTQLWQVDHVTEEEACAQPFDKRWSTFFPCDQNAPCRKRIGHVPKGVCRVWEPGLADSDRLVLGEVPWPDYLDADKNSLKIYGGPYEVLLHDTFEDSECISGKYVYSKVTFFFGENKIPTDLDARRHAYVTGWIQSGVCQYNHDKLINPNVATWPIQERQPNWLRCCNANDPCKDARSRCSWQQTCWYAGGPSGNLCDCDTGQCTRLRPVEAGRKGCVPREGLRGVCDGKGTCVPEGGRCKNGDVCTLKLSTGKWAMGICDADGVCHCDPGGSALRGSIGEVPPDSALQPSSALVYTDDDTATRLSMIQFWSVPATLDTSDYAKMHLWLGTASVVLYVAELVAVPLLFTPAAPAAVAAEEILQTVNTIVTHANTALYVVDGQYFFAALNTFSLNGACVFRMTTPVSGVIYTTKEAIPFVSTITREVTVGGKKLGTLLNAAVAADASSSDWIALFADEFPESSLIGISPLDCAKLAREFWHKGDVGNGFTNMYLNWKQHGKCHYSDAWFQPGFKTGCAYYGITKYTNAALQFYDEVFAGKSSNPDWFEGKTADGAIMRCAKHEMKLGVFDWSMEEFLGCFVGGLIVTFGPHQQCKA